MSDLFANQRPKKEEVYPQVWLLANFANSQPLFNGISALLKKAPLRKMMTPNGHQTGIALSNCGDWGWVSNIHGYRYSAQDPQTNKSWPAMPEAFSKLASEAARAAGYENFEANACLINYYPIGSSLGSHQDKNEKDFSWPIVSVSLGLAAIFQIFGQERSGTPTNISLLDGDVMVWGGKSRLIYHGVKKIQTDPQEPNLTSRFNLTFRRAQ